MKSRNAMKMIRKLELKTFGAVGKRLGRSRARLSWRLSRYGIPRRFQIRAGSQGDVGVVAQIFIDRDYDLSVFAQNDSVMACYERILATGGTPVIFDAGANIGASVVWFASAFPKARVIAIEPEADNCALFRENCQGLAFQLIEGAVGAVSGRAFLTDPGQGDWSFRLGGEGNYEVPIYAANTLVEQHCSDTQRPFIFKIDIEGGEHELFSRNIHWVERFPILIVELHDWMLPGAANSGNFLRAIALLDVDFVIRGENVFCFNNTLLKKMT